MLPVDATRPMKAKRVFSAMEGRCT